MVTRRSAIAGGLSAAAVAAVGGAAALLGGDGDGGAIRTAGARSTGSTSTATTSPAPVADAASAGAVDEQRPPVSAVGAPATVSTPADRVDAPIRVDWVGGSDVAWEGVSLPDRFLRRVPDVDGHPIEMRTRIRQAVMATGVRELVAEAVAAGTHALVMSINPVWLHWDETACNDLSVPRERYACLLTPISASLTAQRADELGALVDAAVDAGVPLYVYTQPHSTDSLDDPNLQASITDAERRIAGYDPGLPTVRFRARIFTRDLDNPLVEGVDFIDMVHPTPVGAKRLGRWLADDIVDFWSSIGFPD